MGANLPPRRSLYLESKIGNSLITIDLQLSFTSNGEPGLTSRRLAAEAPLSKKLLQSLLSPSASVTEDQLATDRQLIAFDRSVRQINRRGFLASFAAATVAATAFSGHTAAAQTAATAPTVVDVLNFALNLEYLEANFYLIASTGTGLSSADMGTGGVAATGATQLQFDATTLAIVQALALDEKNHVELLRSAITTLGGTPISQPAINLAAQGAVTTQAQFLTAARQFTALGNSAYAGGAQLLVSNPAVLTTAAQILGAEGQHAGALNYQCIMQGVTSPAIDAQDVPPTAATYFTVDATHALSPARNTSQVLGVAYGVSTAATTTPATGTTMGGFFPSGFNGNVKST